MKKRVLKRLTGVFAISLVISLVTSVPAYAYQDGDNTYEWISENGKQFWYENGVRQGVYGSSGNVFFDNIERGREIYDRESNGWYWLDAIYDGAKASNKEVFMPYIYSNEESSLDNEDWIDYVSSLSNRTADIVAVEGGEVVDLSAQIKQAILNHGSVGAGKWVRYDANGKMVKGWYKVQGSDEALYPEQVGNIYYYDRQTGLMARGDVTIDGVAYSFDLVSGKLLSGDISADKLYSSDNNNLVSVSKGDTIIFGKYEQDNNLENGKEDIEWTVLDVQGDYALVISEYILDGVKYGNGSRVSWENSIIREWLNNSFYNSSFTDLEKNRISEVENVNTGNEYYDTPGCVNTVDKVFLLSVDEAKAYVGVNGWGDNYKFGHSQNMVASVTPYADERGVYSQNISSGDYSTFLSKQGYNSDIIGKNGGAWWLRTIGNDEKSACYVQPDGAFGYYVSFSNAFTNIGVRPVLLYKFK